MSRASLSGVFRAGEQQRRRQDRLLKLREQGLRDTMIGNAHAYGLAARMLQPFRHFARRAQYEGIAAVRRRLDEPELPVVHAGVLAHLREIAADEGEMVAAIDLPDRANALDGGLVPGMATERVTGIGGVDDHATRAQDLRCAPHEARLGVVGVNGEELCHRTAILNDEWNG